MSQSVNEVTQTYQLDLNAGLTQVLSDGTTTYLYGLGRVSQESGDGVGLFLPDGLGSVRTGVFGGKVSLARDYAPYGAELARSGAGTSGYGYAGEWTDSSGMQYLRARYFRSDIGQFITKDDFQSEETLPITHMAWSYGFNNPITYTDPSGHSPDQPPRPSQPTPPPPSVHVNLSSSIPYNKLGAQNVYLNGKWYYNLCGHISLEMIYETITGSTQTLRTFVNAKDTDEGTSYADLQTLVQSVYPPNWVAKAYSGLPNNIISVKKSRSTFYNELPLTKSWWISKSTNADIMQKVMMEILRRGHYLVASVVLDTGTGLATMHDTSPHGNKSRTYVEHWVVVTAVEGGFVKINNPYSNRVEQVDWGTFNLSVIKSLKAMVEIYPWFGEEEEIDLTSEAEEYGICP